MTSKKVEVEFGYYPSALSIDIGYIQVQTLPGIKEKVHAVTASDGVDAEWLYPPAQMVHQIGGGIQQKPYASRIFGLPKTHVIRHAKIDGDDHLAFLVWVLSFFLGIRLTTTEMGYLDATPIKPGRLVDFAISHSNLPEPGPLVPNQGVLP